MPRLTALELNKQMPPIFAFRFTLCLQNCNNARQALSLECPGMVYKRAPIFMEVTKNLEQLELVVQKITQMRKHNSWDD